MFFFNYWPHYFTCHPRGNKETLLQMQRLFTENIWPCQHPNRTQIKHQELLNILHVLLHSPVISKRATSWYLCVASLFCLFYCCVWYLCFHKLCMILFESTITGQIEEAGVSCHTFYSTEYYSRFLYRHKHLSLDRKKLVNCYWPLKSANGSKAIYTKTSYHMYVFLPTDWL